MTEFIHIEPARERRPDFAVWVLTQDPQPVTTSTGFNVAIDLYPSIPERLLNGAFVDGFHYNRPHPQPVPVVELRIDAEPGPMPVPAAEAPPPRKRAARRKRSTEGVDG